MDFPRRKIKNKIYVERQAYSILLLISSANRYLILRSFNSLNLGSKIQLTNKILLVARVTFTHPNRANSDRHHNFKHISMPMPSFITKQPNLRMTVSASARTPYIHPFSQTNCTLISEEYLILSSLSIEGSPQIAFTTCLVYKISNLVAENRPVTTLVHLSQIRQRANCQMYQDLEVLKLALYREAMTDL